MSQVHASAASASLAQLAAPTWPDIMVGVEAHRPMFEASAPAPAREAVGGDVPMTLWLGAQEIDRLPLNDDEKMARARALVAHVFQKEAA